MLFLCPEEGTGIRTLAVSCTFQTDVSSANGISANISLASSTTPNLSIYVSLGLRSDTHN